MTYSSRAVLVVLAYDKRFFIKSSTSVKAVKGLSQDGYCIILRGHRLNFPKNVLNFLSLKIDFVIANSAMLMKCHNIWHFMWVFTVCQSTHLRVFGLQRVKIYIMVDSAMCPLNYSY